MSFARPFLVSFSFATLVGISPWMRAAIFPQGTIDHSFCCGPRAMAGNAAYDPSGMGLSVLGTETLGASVTAPAAPAVVSAALVQEAAPVGPAIPAPAPGLTAVSTTVSDTTAGAASQPTPAPAPEKPAPKEQFEQDGGYLKVGFDRLAGFRFVPPPFDPAANPDVQPPTGEEQIPDAIKSLDGRKAVVTGFMLPVKMEEGLVTEFLLVKDPMMCCYGVVPNMNEWVVVKMAKGVKPLMDVPVAFYGQLHVGAMFESGYMTGIYRLEGERMGAVQG